MSISVQSADVTKDRNELIRVLNQNLTRYFFSIVEGSETRVAIKLQTQGPDHAFHYNKEARKPGESDG